MTLVIRGGTIVDPSQNLEQKADLLLDQGKVVDIGHIRAKKSWEVISVPGQVVVPGLIDMHVHLREPGREDKETILTGCRAAAAGGFTSIMCMPNTDPVNDNEAITRFILERARQANLVNVFPAGAITKKSQGKELAEVGEMFKSGVVAITDDGKSVGENQIMRKAFEYAKIFDIPIIDHCEEASLAAGGKMNEGAVSTRLGLPGMNRAAEELDVVRDIILSRVTGARVHIAHISTRESLNWVGQAKKQNISVTCEVTPHHFILADSDIKNYDTNFKMHPPLREVADVEAMKQGLADGSIDCIASDHAPHTRLEKETTFNKAAPGIVGLETMLPLCWDYLIRRGTISIKRLVELLSTNPSRILKLDRGSLKIGAVADVTVINPSSETVVDISKFQSKSRNSPFHGWSLRGKSTMTIVKGRIVYSSEE